jgi:hypothetical protein
MHAGSPMALLERLHVALAEVAHRAHAPAVGHMRLRQQDERGLGKSTPASRSWTRRCCERFRAAMKRSEAVALDPKIEPKGTSRKRDLAFRSAHTLLRV